MPDPDAGRAGHLRTVHVIQSSTADVRSTSDALNRPSTDAELAATTPGWALDEVVASMGSVVGKKGGAPDGARILIELNGPVARSIRVSAGPRRGGRGFLGPESTTTISPRPAVHLVASGGRPMTPNRPQAIDYDGDVAVGERIVANPPSGVI